jgi:hypothetical protein
MTLIGSDWVASVLACVLALSAGASVDARGDEPKEPGKLGLTKPILCKEIRGYEDYEERPDNSLTRDEKLLLYFRPLHYKEKKVGTKNQVHFRQEFRIRKQGQKAVVWTKKELSEYKNTFTPPAFVYLHNTVSLKELKPGEYEYEIVVFDEIGGAKATQVIPFKVVESKTAEKPDPKKEPARKDARAGS